LAQYFVNRIRFTGNRSTRDDVIRREVLLKERDVFNSSLLDDSLLRLNRLGIFDEIKPE
jgi:outer membrane protein insertion porin family